jgi:hypothetical protein
MRKTRLVHFWPVLLLATVLVLAGWADDASFGAAGTPGAAGTAGADGGNVEVLNFHGSDFLRSTGEFAEGDNPLRFVTATITGADATEGGTVTIAFTVAENDADATPVTGITSVNANIVKLEPAANGESFNQWVPYIYRTETVSGTEDPAGNPFDEPDGFEVEQGYRESCDLTDRGDGSYTCVLPTNIASVVTPVAGTAITFDDTLTHRVSIQMGGRRGPTDDDTFDFVPDGSAVTETRNIVETAACTQCHGEEFRSHGGDRLSVENCVTCHNPAGTDAQGGETLDMQVMIHRIHAGGELATIPGDDGIVWDDPATPEDEHADNGEYAIWGDRDTKHEWWKVEFPAVISNCMKCHQETGGDHENWKNNPNRVACGSCHNNVDFATGTNHGGGVQANDNSCTTCHPASGVEAPFIKPITVVHDWTRRDQRHIPEFQVDLTASDPPNGEYFEAGESPVITIVINEDDDGDGVWTPVADHHITSESNTSGEGCAKDACPPRDGIFTGTALFVHGPRARRVPVLTTAARVEILASGAGPFDLSAAHTLEITFDGGKDLFKSDTALREIVSGTVSVDIADGTFADLSAATATEIMDWLNGDAAFAARGIAYIDEASGLLAIRSRNLGTFYSLQLSDGTMTTAVFGSDTAVKVIGGFTVSASIADTADPKLAQFADRIEYTLDTVDDLQPGTYMVGVEFADRGRPSTSNYKTPSVAKARFQVGQADEELAPAGNCALCHQGPDGRGFVLDYYRHDKIFDNTAVDQCGQCHDYQSQTDTAGSPSSDGWNGSRPISRRVHAVHYGSSLNYPLLTVNYQDADPIAGRKWDITYSQDIRNCETCHPDGTTSGTWITKAARTPCSGCHDSDAATAHMKLMTYDPTPALPWNGDQEESCQTCH